MDIKLKKIFFSLFNFFIIILDIIIILFLNYNFQFRFNNKFMLLIVILYLIILYFLINKQNKNRKLIYILSIFYFFNLVLFLIVGLILINISQDSTLVFTNNIIDISRIWKHINLKVYLLRYLQENNIILNESVINNILAVNSFPETIKKSIDFFILEEKVANMKIDLKIEEKGYIEISLAYIDDFINKHKNIVLLGVISIGIIGLTFGCYEYYIDYCANYQYTHDIVGTAVGHPLTLEDIDVIENNLHMDVYSYIAQYPNDKPRDIYAIMQALEAEFDLSILRDIPENIGGENIASAAVNPISLNISNNNNISANTLGGVDDNNNI